MKYRKWWGLFLFIIILYPESKAFASSQLEGHEIIGNVPIAPLQGRSNEGQAPSYLNSMPLGSSVWYSRGKRYLSRKEFEQAIWAFRKASEDSPLSGEVRFMLGFSYEARRLEGLPGDQTAWDELAEIEYRAAIDFSDYLPARFNLGVLLVRLHRPTEARKEFEHILLVSPNSSLGKRAEMALERCISFDLLPQVLTSYIPTTSSSSTKNHGWGKISGNIPKKAGENR